MTLVAAVTFLVGLVADAVAIRVFVVEFLALTAVYLLHPLQFLMAVNLLYKPNVLSLPFYKIRSIPRREYLYFEKVNHLQVY